MSLHPDRLSGFLVAAALIAGTTALVHAQATRTLSTVDRRIDTLNRQAKDFERDNMGLDVSKKAKAEAAKRTRQIRIDMEEDLKALQKIYNDTVTAMHAGRGFPPGFAAETGRAVKKHATRLRSNLALPDYDETEARTGPPPLPDTDRKALTELCKVIYEFVMNPMFDGTGTLDVKNGAKAKLELDAMIRLADHLSIVPETDSQ